MYKQLALLALATAFAGVSHALEDLRQFNPAISVIFDGLYYHDTADGEGPTLLEEHAAVLHAHEEDEHVHAHAGLNRGFNLRETELTLSGTVDPYFDAWLSAALRNDELELEESWIQTRSLPAGLQLKAGKFLSGIAYHNEKHLHAWNFADQNLAYLSMFGDHGLADTGVQLTWLAPSRQYLLVGVEALQGNELERFGMSVDPDVVVETLDDEFAVAVEEDALGLVDRSGPALGVVFVRFAPDLGAHHGLQLGASWAHHRRQSAFHEEGADALVSEGAADLYAVQAVLKRFASGSHGAGSITLQGEYFRLRSDQKAVYHTDASELGIPLGLKQEAAYLQSTWGFLPRWELGLRTAATGINSSLREDDEREDIPLSRQNSLALTWYATEFSKLRLQFNHNDVRTEDGSEEFNQVMLQYNLSLGAHGAHHF